MNEDEQYEQHISDKDYPAGYDAESFKRDFGDIICPRNDKEFEELRHYLNRALYWVETLMEGPQSVDVRNHITWNALQSDSHRRLGELVAGFARDNGFTSKMLGKE
jgi:hypothetical protein